MHVTGTVWAITVAVLIAVLAVDIFIIGRRPHEPSMKECTVVISVFVTLAVIFGAFVWWVWGTQYGIEFFAGWLTEYSLSLDNLFVFIIIMTKMRVPRQYQQFALMVGIVLALVFRGIFIALGAAIISRFTIVFLFFGLFLLYTAVKLVLDYYRGEEEDADENFLMKMVRTKLPSTQEYHGTHLLARVDGRRVITPMLMVVVALGSTDILFALDSIPAIFGLTKEPYLVFAATVFALMGLRQLYFLIGGLLQKLVYLSLGLSVILAFIGVKLVLETFHIGFPIWVSLTVIVVVLAVTTILSLAKSKFDERNAGTDLR